MGIENPKEAGKGQSAPYVFGADGGRGLTSRFDYLAIDAVAWFINKDSSWFNDRTASGTLEIALDGGVERFSVALGTFALRDGQRVAPIFDRPILPTRAYRSGSITLTARLTGIKKDTAFSQMLKGAADASLGIVKGMVETATLAGPSKILGGAGTSLIGSVQGLLGGSGEGQEPFFDASSGLEITLRPAEIQGEGVYVLLHRGTELKREHLSVQERLGLQLPFYQNELIQDGAWLLLRLRRTPDYGGGPRVWEDAARLLRTDIRAVLGDRELGLLTKDEALERFKISQSGDTLADRMRALTTLIRNDAVLTEADAGTRSGAVRQFFAEARKAIEQDNLSSFQEEYERSLERVREGQVNHRSLRPFEAELSGALARSRPALESMSLEALSTQPYTSEFLAEALPASALRLDEVL